MNREFINELNKIYSDLERKEIQVIHALFHRIFEIESGWYGGHYHKDENGEWIRESYPIPVVSVKGICDVEISFEEISVSAKLKRKKALEYSYEKILCYQFEAFGVEDYLSDFYKTGQTVEELKKNISESDEKEIFFTFKVPDEMDEDGLYKFVKLLRAEGFYY